MTITAKIIADSVSPEGARLTTMQLRYQRFIHAEVMTHRAFSRNASSSRAIPVSRLIQDVIDDPAMPIHWGKNQKGMQADQEHDALVVFRNDAVPPDAAWLRARDVAVDAALRFDKAGFHKQVVNRLLEPFAHINVLVTATDWGNFFTLRDHPDAQPEIQALAQAMQGAMDASIPNQLWGGDWHLPYLEPSYYREWFSDGHKLDACMISAARCARVSYLTHDGKPSTYDQDIDLYARLAGGVPFHASPLEHQARPKAGRHANLNGWQSFRTEQGL